jgi:eukaryotic-like serine/threonine-protein kinase
MSFGDRLRWMLRMAMLLFILASVAFLSALTAMRFAIRGREVQMPDLVGMPASEARPMLQSLRIGLKVEDRIYSQWPLDAVVRQSPLPSMNVKVGQDAHVVLSLGPQKVTIPELEDKSVRAAQVELLRGGMQLGEVSNLYLPGSGSDTVARQYPAANTSDATSSHVDFLVALGPRPLAYVMPDFLGASLGDAEARLSAAGLKVAKFTPVSAPGASHGTVVEQNPTRGERVDAKSMIEFQVAN